MRFQTARWSGAALLLVAAAAPVHGQGMVDLSVGATPAVRPDTAAVSRIHPLRPPGLVPQGDMIPEYRPVEILALPSEQAPRWSTTRSTLIGVLAGGVVGSIIFLAQADEECRSPDSMCGLEFPLYAGAGALTGGAIGFVFSISTR